MAEGLVLVTSSSHATGYRGVTRGHKGDYKPQISEDGKQNHLGAFTAAEEMALCYARHLGAERAATEAAEAEGECSQPLERAAEIQVAAEAEGLVLVTSSSNATGYKGVYRNDGQYVARIRERGKPKHLGTFATAEEAALCYARPAGAERAAREAAEAKSEGPQPLTVEEAREAAEAEGLVLLTSSSNATGYKGVYRDRDKYKPSISENGKVEYLGTFATAEEAALAYARHVGNKRAAEEAVATLPVADGALVQGRTRRRLNAEQEASGHASLLASEEEPLYAVESLLAVRRAPTGTREFLIRWLGYSAAADSWEPEANIVDPELIHAWDRQQSGARIPGSTLGYSPYSVLESCKSVEVGG